MKKPTSSGPSAANWLPLVLPSGLQSFPSGDFETAKLLPSRVSLSQSGGDWRMAMPLWAWNIVPSPVPA